jgi:hypothetical protein
MIAILLLPVCVGAGWALWMVLQASGSADVVWVPTIAGVACWLVVYLLLPKPMLVYVFGHELTHALWAWLFGGKVKKFKATAKGGHVVVTKTNFLIALAPYFFPLYAVLVVLFFLIGHWVWNWRHYLPWFHLFLVRLPCIPHLAHSQTQPNGYQRTGVSFLRCRDFSWERRRAAPGDSASGRESGPFHGLGLVVRMHREIHPSARPNPLTLLS